MMRRPAPNALQPPHPAPWNADPLKNREALNLPRASGPAAMQVCYGPRGTQWGKSVAGMILTTEALVTDAPEKKSATPPMPGGGDMYD